jgi:hypothetical protein
MMEKLLTPSILKLSRIFVSFSEINSFNTSYVTRVTPKSSDESPAKLG